jgi:signal peptidase
MLAVQTASMRPLIAPGDAVFVRSVAASTLQDGDVVSYKSPANPRRTITHRIIAIDHTAKTLNTKGDAAPRPDTAINQSQLIGKVSLVVPKMGWLLDALHKPLGLALLIYVPALTIISYEIVKFLRTTRVSTYQLGVRP